MDESSIGEVSEMKRKKYSKKFLLSDLVLISVQYLFWQIFKEIVEN